MREAVVVASSRTALAKSFRGSFNMTRPDELAAHCIKDILRKTPKLDPSEIEDVVLGCAQPHGPQGHNVARISSARRPHPYICSPSISSGLEPDPPQLGFLRNTYSDGTMPFDIRWPL
jgi:Thiolase, N-terminal domain